jgi:multiple sugar transport system permease protein
MESIVLVDIWQWTPFVVLVVLAGLQSIPDYLYEAAQLDGASDWHQFRFITLPVIAFHLQLVILLRVIDGFRLFDKVYALTGGGPGHATETITMYIFKEGFRYFNLGYAAAASLVMLLLILAVSLVYTKRMWREMSDEA